MKNLFSAGGLLTCTSPGPRRTLDPGLVFLLFSFQKFHPCTCVTYGSMYAAVFTRAPGSLPLRPSACLAWQKVWHFFHAIRAQKYIWFLPFCTTLIDLDLHWDSQETAQSKTGCRHFLQFSTEWDQIYCGDEVVQGEHPNTTFEWGFSTQGKWVLFYWLCSKMFLLAWIRTHMIAFDSNLVWW